MKYLFTFIAIYSGLSLYFLNPATNYFLNKSNANPTYNSPSIRFNNKVADLYSSDSLSEQLCQTEDIQSVVDKKPPQTIIGTDIESEIANIETTFFYFTARKENQLPSIQLSYWATLHSIESKQGKLLYRPQNKYKSCSNTSSPCGHHQLSLQALKDISCNTKQCRKDRENFTKSLAMSKQLQKINQKRLLKAGYSNLPDYQKYLIHQQGANGFKTIIAASQGKKALSRNIKNNMSGNSPYSYKSLNKMGNQLAAKNFLKHWKEKWENENKLIIAKQSPVALVNNSTTATNNDSVLIKTINSIQLPLFDKDELLIALNLKI